MRHSLNIWLKQLSLLPVDLKPQQLKFPCRSCHGAITWMLLQLHESMYGTWEKQLTTLAQGKSSTGGASPSLVCHERYRRNWLLSACAYSNGQQETMRLTASVRLIKTMRLTTSFYGTMCINTYPHGFSTHIVHAQYRLLLLFGYRTWGFSKQRLWNKATGDKWIWSCEAGVD